MHQAERQKGEQDRVSRGGLPCRLQPAGDQGRAERGEKQSADNCTYCQSYGIQPKTLPEGRYE